MIPAIEPSANLRKVYPEVVELYATMDRIDEAEKDIEHLLDNILASVRSMSLKLSEMLEDMNDNGKNTFPTKR